MSKRWLWYVALAAALAGCTIELPDQVVSVNTGEGHQNDSVTTTTTSADNGGDVDR